MSDLRARAKQLFTDDPDLCVEVICYVNDLLRINSGLTLRQRALLDFIRAQIIKTGMTPTYDEMADHLGLVSKSGINRLVVALEERGKIRRLPNRSRAMEVVGLG